MRVAVIGVGYLGTFHARIYAGMQDVSLVGVVDSDSDRAAQVARETGCEVFDDFRSLIGKVDAVSIVVPTVAHCEVALPLIDAGIHMLMEKPIAPTVDEAARLVEAAERRGIVFQVGHLERFNAGVMALSQRVQDPRFIEVHRLSTFVDRATDVDVVTDLMIHDIDIVLSLVRSPLTSIAASGVGVLTDHADIANARLEFENGAVANVTASRISARKLRRIRVFGDHRYYGLDYVDQSLEMAYALPAQESAPGIPRIVTEQVAIEPCKPLDAELRSFIDTVRQGSTPLVTGRVGLEALRVALRVKEKIPQ